MFIYLKISYLIALTKKPKNLLTKKLQFGIIAIQGIEATKVYVIIV